MSDDGFEGAGTKKKSLKDYERERKNLVIRKHNRALKRLTKMLAFQIFLLVADADGVIDPKEIAKFKTFLMEREEHSTNPFTQRIFHLTIINYSSLSDQYQKGSIEKSMDDLIKTMKYIEMCVSCSVMKSICHDLEELAFAIAEASGALFGIGSAVSDEENKVLVTLRKVFASSVQNAHGPTDVDPDTFLLIRNS